MRLTRPWTWLPALLLGATAILMTPTGATADECGCRLGLRGVHIGHGERGGRTPHFYFPRGRPEEACRQAHRHRYVPRYLRQARGVYGGSWRSLRRRLVAEEVDAPFARLDCYFLPHLGWVDTQEDETDTARAHLNEGALALHVGEIDAARASLRQALAVADAPAEIRTAARLGTALAEIMAGRYAAARPHLADLARTGALDATQRLDATMLGDTERWKQAERVLRSYRRFESSDPDGHLAAVWLHQLQGKTSRARAILGLLERRWPEDAEAHALRTALAEAPEPPAELMPTPDEANGPTPTSAPDRTSTPTAEPAESIASR